MCFVICSFALTFVLITHLPETDNTNVNILSFEDNHIGCSDMAKPLGSVNVTVYN